MRYHQNTVQGALYILLSELMFASMGAAVKAASGTGYLFWGEILDWLFVAGALLIALAGVVAVRGQWRRTAVPVMQTEVKVT